MFLDKLLAFSESQAVTGSVDSTNSIDIGHTKGFGPGKVMGALITVEADATGAVTASLVTASDAGFSADVKSVSYALPAGAVAGDKFYLAIPSDSYFAERFYKMSFVAGGSTITVSTHLQPADMVDNYVSHPDAITIS